MHIPEQFLQLTAADGAVLGHFYVFILSFCIFRVILALSVFLCLLKFLSLLLFFSVFAKSTRQENGCVKCIESDFCCEMIKLPMKNLIKK